MRNTIDTRIHKVARWQTPDGKIFSSEHAADKHLQKKDIILFISKNFEHTVSEDQACQFADAFLKEFEIRKCPRKIKDAT